MHRIPSRLALLFALPLAACATPQASRRPAAPAHAKAAPAAPKPAPVPPLPAPPSPGRLPQAATPTGYEIHLTVDPRKPRFEGDVTLHLDLHQRANALPFQALHMHLTKVEAIAGKKTYEATVAPGSWPGAEPAEGDHLAKFKAVLPEGEVDLHFVYDAPFDPALAGLYRAKDGGKWYAYTQFEVADARKCFPGMDEPGFKQPFQVTVTIPQGMKAFSNTPALARSTTGGETTIQFEKTKPLPTYLVALVVGDEDVVAGPKMDVPLRGLADHGKGPLLKTGLAMSAKFLKYQEKYFGIPYPYPKLDHAALSEFAAGAMENAGLITYREEDFLIDPKHTPKFVRAGIARDIAHEQSHQWFGDLVTMDWWNDIWLNEAFATWMSAKTVDATMPQYHQRIGLLDGRGWVFGADSLSAARAIRQPVHSVAEAEQSFDGITYVKGANLLTMLEDWLGAKTFQKGIRAYLHAHAWKNATSADLLAALDTASGKPVTKVADTFLNRAGAPEVSLALSCKKGAKPTITLTQTRYRPLGSHFAAGLPKTGPWMIPVCYAYPVGHGVVRSCFILDTAHATRTLDKATRCPRWVHPNAGEYGYYRWSVPEKMLPALARAVARPNSPLDATGPDAGDPRSQDAFLNQAYASVRAGTLSPATYLRILDTLARHGDVTTYKQVAGSLSGIAGTWPGLAKTPAFARYVRRTLGREGRRLGWKPKKGEAAEIGRLRQSILFLLGHYGREQWILRGAVQRAKGYLAHPEKMNPGVGGLALALATYEGKIPEARLEAFLAKAKTPFVRLAALGALGTLPPGPGLDKALALTLTDKVRTQDVIRILGAAFQHVRSRPATLDFVSTHWPAIARRLSSFLTAMSAFPAQVIGGFCTPAARDHAKAFFANAEIPHVGRYLDQGTERADQCIALKAYGERPLASFLGVRAKAHPGHRAHAARHRAHPAKHAKNP